MGRKAKTPNVLIVTKFTGSGTSYVLPDGCGFNSLKELYAYFDTYSITEFVLSYKSVETKFKLKWVKS